MAVNPTVKKRHPSRQVMQHSTNRRRNRSEIVYGFHGRVNDTIGFNRDL